jgi:hypothetical protein
VIAVAGALNQGAAAQNLHRRVDGATGSIHLRSGEVPSLHAARWGQSNRDAHASARPHRAWNMCWLAKRKTATPKARPEVQQRCCRRFEPMRGLRVPVWVTTERRHVTLQGCVGSVSEQRALVARVVGVDGVEHVFDQLIIGTRSAPRWPVDPPWVGPKGR